MKKYNNLNRSFARRVGKTMSDLKKNILKNDLPKYLYTPEKNTENIYNKTFLEIGFGMGEHLANQAQLNPDNLYIGVEVYSNGVANFLKQATSLKLNNFMVWPDDLDLILDKIPAKSLSGVYVLFPDPWPKRKQIKKRIFNIERFEHFKNKLKKGGFIAFASDIEDYFTSVYKLLDNNSNFTISSKNTHAEHDGYIQTKYHSKAIKEGRTAQFFQAILKE